MSVSDDFRGQLALYMANDLSLDDLFRWLAEHVQAISVTGDEALRELEAQVWIRIDDIDEGSDTEDDFREWLVSEAI